VTNRRHAIEAAIRDNLAKHGFPLDLMEDTLFTRGEHQGWEGSQETETTELHSREEEKQESGDP